MKLKFKKQGYQTNAVEAAADCFAGQPKREGLSERPRVADQAYFKGKVLKTTSGDVEVTAEMATDIEFYLIQNGYVDKKRSITQKYHDAKKEGTLAALPGELTVHAVFSDTQLPEIGDDRMAKTNPLNANFEKVEFKALWNRINHKAAYTVEFETPERVAP